MLSELFIGVFCREMADISRQGNNINIETESTFLSMSLATLKISAEGEIVTINSANYHVAENTFEGQTVTTAIEAVQLILA